MNEYKINIETLKKRIDSACARASRDAGEIRIIAASKYADTRQIQEVAGSGINEFGENRAEELVGKYRTIKERVIWHFFGHLQSRKIKLVVPIVEYIHSVDSVSTVEKINKEAFLTGKIQKILLEVNISGEESKYGMHEEEIDFYLKKSRQYRNIEVEGFMTMAPLTEDRDLISGVFSKLHMIMVEKNKKYPDIRLSELSMGMSNDFEIAIEKGATMIRIGSLIFK